MDELKRNIILLFIFSVLLGVTIGDFIGQYQHKEYIKNMIRDASNSDMHMIRFGHEYYFVTPYEFSTSKQNDLMNSTIEEINSITEQLRCNEYGGK